MFTGSHFIPNTVKKELLFLCDSHFPSKFYNIQQLKYQPLAVAVLTSVISLQPTFVQACTCKR